MSMKFKERDGYVVDEQGRMVCIFADEANAATRSLVIKAPKMLEAINAYVETIENGGYAGKKTYKAFKDVLNRLYEED